ncbi:MAG: serine/threonine-protein kinase [Fuerstiella sp.]|nr:serine/threonine-protein kinase [Fuerstiella sp.]
MGEVCGDDHEQRFRVTALLRAYDDAGSFLETPAGGPRPTDEISLSFLKPIDKEGCLGTIGPYEVLEVIGRGGMGLVLRAVDLKLNRVVAVKVLLPELAANPNARRRFLREARAAAAVSHPHVVTIHAVDEAKGDGTDHSTPPYLVMECVVGQSLQQKLARVGVLRLAEILRISRQIGEGLAEAHKQGLIHRDIKPANILLENGVERVKITDFGLARAVDDITVTRTDEVSGTPQYMSPEQANGQCVDHSSDLFSLGCVMYAMCTGHSPFRGDSLAHVIKRVTQDTPRPIAEQNAEVPPWLVQIIDCLLQKDADERFQSAEGLVAILDQHLARIQQPTDSGSHSLINQQVPAAVNSSGSPPSESAPAVVPAGTANRIGVPGWIQGIGRILISVSVIGTVLMLADPMSRGFIGRSESLAVFLLGAWPMLMGAFLCRRQMTREALPAVLFLGLGPLGLVIYLFVSDKLEPATAPDEEEKQLRRARVHKSGGALAATGGFLLLLGCSGLVVLATGVFIVSSSSRVDQHLHQIVIGLLIAGLVFLFIGLMLRDSGDRSSSPILYYLLLGPLGIVLWLVDQKARDRRQQMEVAAGRPLSRQPDCSHDYSAHLQESVSRSVASTLTDASFAADFPRRAQRQTSDYRQADAGQQNADQFAPTASPVSEVANTSRVETETPERLAILATDERQALRTVQNRRQSVIGIVLSLAAGAAIAAFLLPNLILSTAAATAQAHLFRFPAILFGIWTLQMLGNLIFNRRRAPAKYWALYSSAAFSAMAFGWFWATVLRMPATDHSNVLTQRTLIELGLLPSMIWVLYCVYVYRELPASEDSVHASLVNSKRTRIVKQLVSAVAVVVVAGIWFVQWHEYSSRRIAAGAGGIVIHHHGDLKPTAIFIEGHQVAASKRTETLTYVSGIKPAIYDLAIIMSGPSNRTHTLRQKVRVKADKSAEVNLRLPIELNAADDLGPANSEYGGLILDFADQCLHVMLVGMGPDMPGYYPMEIPAGRHKVPVGRYSVMIFDKQAGWLKDVRSRPNGDYEKSFNNIDRSLGILNQSLKLYDRDTGTWSVAQYTAEPGIIEIKPVEFQSVVAKRNYSKIASQNGDFEDGKFHRFQWMGKSYSLTAIQARIVNELLERLAKSGAATLDEQSLLVAVNSLSSPEAQNVMAIFNGGEHTAWDELIRYIGSEEDREVALTAFTVTGMPDVSPLVDSHVPAPLLPPEGLPPANRSSEAVVMSAQPARGERAGTLHVTIEDDGMRLAVRRKSAFGGYVPGSEQQVDKVGQSQLRLHPGDYELGIQDRFFGWPMKFRTSNITMQNGGLEELSVKRNLSDLPQNYYPSAFLWDAKEFRASNTFSSWGRSQMLAINILLAASGQSSSTADLLLEVRDNLKGYKMGIVLPAEPMPDTVKDILDPLPPFIVPGEEEGTLRLVPAQRATVSMSLLDSGLHATITAVDKNAGVSDRHLGGFKKSPVEAEYRLLPGEYEITVIDALAYWSQVDNNGFQGRNLTNQVVKIKLETDDHNEFTFRRNLKALVEFDTTSVELSKSQSLHFGWGKPRGYSAPSYGCNQAQSQCVQRLLQAVIDETYDVSEADLQMLTGQPMNELFPDLTQKIGHWLLIKPGEQPNTWRLAPLSE